MNRFVYYQPNPRGKRGEKTRPDCAIRAMSKFLGMDWLTTFDLMCATAREIYDVPNSIKTMEKLLFDHERVGVNTEAGKKRMSVIDFCKAHPKGTYLLRVANHMVCVSDGKYYDVWDSGKKCVYFYWVR